MCFILNAMHNPDMTTMFVCHVIGMQGSRVLGIMLLLSNYRICELLLPSYLLLVVNLTDESTATFSASKLPTGSKECDRLGT